MITRYFRFAGFGFFGALALIAVASTLVPLSRSRKWFVRIFDYPRLQTLMIAVFALLWYASFYYKRNQKGLASIFVLTAVIIAQAYKAWPYTPLGKKQVVWAPGGSDEASSISLLICNVLQTNTAYHKVIEKVSHYDPDLLITTETDIEWQKALEEIESNYPHRIAVPLSNTYGMHLYSKLELKDDEVRFLVDKEIPSIRTQVQLRSGDWITLFIVHPPPPVPQEAETSKERDAEIIMVGKEARKEKGGVIVAGDFNDVAWSETTELFQQVTGYLDPRRGRGFYNTYHSRNPLFRWPLDHIFHSNHFMLEALNRVGNVNSDHFPMYVKLNYKPEEQGRQPEVAAEKDTEEKAAEAIS